jgi:phosphoglycerate dehydrogenase-like enzyme
LKTPTVPILILSSRAEAYQALLVEMLPGSLIVAARSPEQALSLAASSRVVLGDPSLVKQILPDLTALEWVQSTWAGVDALMGEGLRKDYTLTNVRGVFGPAIAEYVIGYAIMHERLGWQRYNAQQAGRWDATPPGSLRGKTMGIIGVGSIGADLAHAVKVLGVTTLGYTRANEGCPAIDRYYHGDAITDFAAACDYVVCTLPNTVSSRHLVDARVLAAMRSHAVFVNVGRGSAVDEQALGDALARGAIGGAILDVFQVEPLPVESQLWKLPNVIITSHTAALSFPDEIAPLFVDNYRRWINEQPLRYAVDFALGY